MQMAELLNPENVSVHHKFDKTHFIFKMNSLNFSSFTVPSMQQKAWVTRQNPWDRGMFM